MTGARGDRKGWFKVLAMLTSVFLIFGGPTYLIYGLRAVDVPPSYATLIGLAAFVMGIIIFMRFVAREAKI